MVRHSYFTLVTEAVEITDYEYKAERIINYPIRIESSYRDKTNSGTRARRGGKRIGERIRSRLIFFIFFKPKRTHSTQAQGHAQG